MVKMGFEAAEKRYDKKNNDNLLFSQAGLSPGLSPTKQKTHLSTS